MNEEENFYERGAKFFVKYEETFCASSRGWCVDFALSQQARRDSALSHRSLGLTESFCERWGKFLCQQRFCIVASQPRPQWKFLLDLTAAFSSALLLSLVICLNEWRWQHALTQSVCFRPPCSQRRQMGTQMISKRGNVKNISEKAFSANGIKWINGKQLKKVFIENESESDWRESESDWSQGLKKEEK